MRACSALIAILASTGCGSPNAGPNDAAPDAPDDGEEEITTPREPQRDIAADHSALQWTGRWDRTDPAAPRCNWTGCGVRFKTNAREIRAAMGDGTPAGIANYDGRTNTFALYVDGARQDLLPALSRNQTTTVTVAQLDGEPHTVEIVKASEAMRGLVEITGLTLIDSSEPVRASTRPYVEFIGDSITCGAGNLGAPGGCEAQDYEDGSLSYAGVAAAALGADRAILCISGIRAQDAVFQASVGVTATNANAPGNALAFGAGAPVYGDMPTVSWQDDREAKAVVINLGTNDTSGGLNESGYKAAMHALIDGAAARHATAHIVLMIGPMVTEAQFGAIADDIIATSPHQDRLSKLVVPFDTSSRVGCTGHPNVAHAADLGATLAAHLEQQGAL